MRGLGPSRRPAGLTPLAAPRTAPRPPCPGLPPPAARAAVRALLAWALVVACGPAAPPEETRRDAPARDRRDTVLVDAAGVPHEPGAPPERIVSLVPSATAILLALGAGDRLVGRTAYDTAAALAALPSVGGGIRPDLERLLALRPDLVVRFAGPSDLDTPGRLDRLGVPHFAVRPDRVADVRRTVRQLGRIVARRPEADSLLARMDSALAEVRRAVAGRPPVRTAYLLGGTPHWVAGPGTFLDELIGLAGGVNVFADLDTLYAPVSAEELVARRVDVYLTRRGTTLDERYLVPGAPVRELSPSVEIPGPRVGEAAREVARALRPGILR